MPVGDWWWGGWLCSHPHPPPVSDWQKLVGPLKGLLNDISFVIVGLPGKLPKASDYFLFSKEKIKELILLSGS